MKYFKSSIIVSIVGFLCAYFWGEHVTPGSGFSCLFIVLFLSILETTLSFDNAVVNAMKLKNMESIWQHRFLTWGIAIAVFGMRFLFPVFIVSIFSGHNLIEVIHLALTDIKQYTHYLHVAHLPLVTFGGTFLLMLCLDYFITKNLHNHWIAPIENKIVLLAQFKGVDVLITLLLLLVTQLFVPMSERMSVISAGLFGVVLFILINMLCAFAEKISESKTKINAAGEVAKGGFLAFLYLELIDASFSLDGVLGSFAISKDIIIITIGLAIGAMFVRSLTIFMVEKETLQQYRYLEHGAHWAIGFLALIMLVSVRVEVPEVVTGLVGLVIIAFAFRSSLIANKNGN